MINAPPRPMIQLANLTRMFGSTIAVNNLSFEVYPGEVFGFIGPNGAGKTTSMRILATLDIPTSGDAFVDGFSCMDDPERVRRRLGFMPDNFGTYPNVNCEEYLDFFARAYGLRGRERIRALREVMAFTQLDQMANKPITGLSKGMKQRLCLGRTMIHDPKVLILDEPAAGLDPRARIELRDIILRLADAGKSLLISSHILTELAEMCSRVAIIEQGALLAVGSVDDILKGKLNVSQPDSSERQPTDGGVALESYCSVEAYLANEDQVVQFKDWLEDQDDIRDCVRIGRTIKFEMRDQDDAKADLLTNAIQAGFRLTSFAPKQRSLEEAFLHVTQGRVQ